MPPRTRRRSTKPDNAAAGTGEAAVQPEAGPSNPVKPLEIYRTAFNEELKKLVVQFEERRVAQGHAEALSPEELANILDSILERLPVYEGPAEVQKTILEKALESMVVNLPELVSGDWRDDEAHLLMYEDTLDVLVTFLNREELETSLAAVTIEALLEVQTVQSTEYLFGYLESRMDRLTEGMIPGKGKALIFLRLLNDLLRRLSKSTHTVFCGRILLFLANIFPLGERSGVNLRGEYNKENVTAFEEPVAEVEEEVIPEKEDEEEDSKMVQDSLLPPKVEEKVSVDPEKKPAITVEAPEDGEEVEESGMDVDLPAKVADSKISPSQKADQNRAGNEPEFYILFWSIQRFFSDPPSLFSGTVHSSLPSTLSTYAASFPSLPPLAKDGSISSTPTAAGTPNLTLLRQGLQKLLDVFHDASKDEKALQGATKDGTSKPGSRRVADDAPVTPSTSGDDVRRMFFYPKFLTSKNLLELEVADSNFRKQVMVQCLILFQYLHSCTEATRLRQQIGLSQPNRSVLPLHRLSEADNKWVTDLEARTYTEISRTPGDGEYFVKTVRLVLQGERNWSHWKANSCPDIEKKPLASEAADEAKTQKRKLEQPTPGFPHKAGTAALSRLWRNEPKKIEDSVPSSRNLDRYFDAVKRQNALIKEKKEELEAEGKTSAAEQALDYDLRQMEERKASLAWRTLRIASSTQLHLFGKIGVNDIEKLMEEMAKPPAGLPQAQAAGPAGVSGSSDPAIVKEEGQPSQNETVEGDSGSAAKRPRPDSIMEVDGPEGEQAKKPKVAA